MITSCGVNSATTVLALYFKLYGLYTPTYLSQYLGERGEGGGGTLQMRYVTGTCLITRVGSIKYLPDTQFLIHLGSVTRDVDLHRSLNRGVDTE